MLYSQIYQLASLLRSKQVPWVTLVMSDEERVHQFALQEFRKAVGSGVEQHNAFPSSLDSPSLFSQTQNIVVSVKKIEAKQHALHTFFQQRNHDIKLLLLTEQISVQSNLYQQIDQSGAIFPLKGRKVWDQEKDLIELLYHELDGVTFPEQATRSFVQSCNLCPLTLCAELDKLKLYVYPNTQIRQEDIHALLVRTDEQNVFELTDAICRQDASKAFAWGHSLHQTPLNPVQFLRQMHTQFMQLYLVKSSLVDPSLAPLIQQRYPYLRGRVLEIKQDIARRKPLEKFARFLATTQELEREYKQYSPRDDIFMDHVLNRLLTLP